MSLTQQSWPLLDIKPQHNLSGNPALTVPCGWGGDGLPIGLQLIGPHLADDRLLRAAALFERARP